MLSYEEHGDPVTFYETFNEIFSDIFYLIQFFGLGEDCDLCSDLLLDTLEALRALPEALLFKERKMSPVWIDVMEKSSTFLQQIVLKLVKLFSLIFFFYKK